MRTLAWWLLTGGSIGMVNTLSLQWTVARLHPDAPRRAVTWTVMGALLRWGLAAALLIAALQHGVASTLVAFSGLWLVRWGTVCGLGLCRSS
jgi:hypothetical protein